jgi:hypothetical protein
MINYETIVQPQEFTVEQVFNNNEYLIPIYQRNYAWSRFEIEQLLDDINDIDINKTKKYYLGNLIVNERSINCFEVIDGQQRLTTLFLLLCFLNNQSINEGSLKFEARETSNRTLNFIKAWKARNDKSGYSKNLYSQEIIEGYSIISKYFAKKNSESISEFNKKLSAIMLIRTQVPKNIDLNHYFEIMNTRGEQLELHEIMKAKMLGAIKSSDTERDRLDKIIASTIWDACSQMNKYVQMCFPIEKRKSIFGKSWNSFDIGDFDELRNLFDEENLNNETEFTLESKLRQPIYSLNASIKEDSLENERFESIVTFPNFLLLVNEAMSLSDENKDNDAGLDDKRFLEIMKAHWSSKDAALNFIFSLLKYRYIFDQYIIKREYIGQYRLDGKWSLQQLTSYREKKHYYKPYYLLTFNSTSRKSDKSKYDSEINNRLCWLESCLRITYTSPKTMHWIARVMADVNKNPDGNHIIPMLEKYCCEKIEESKYQIRTGFNIDRIVFTYLDYILLRDEFKLFRDFQFQFRTSIEHFFPRNPENIKDADCINNIDSFGNLALITVSANSKFSNMIPKHKVEQYPEIINQSPKLIKMKRLLDENGGAWDSSSIDEHKVEMFKLLDDEIKDKIG